MAWGFKKAPETVSETTDNKPKAEKPKINERLDVLRKHGAHDTHNREAPPRRQR